MRLLGVVAALLAWLACAFGATPAFAHATLIASEPADGAVIAAAPPQLTLTFNEPVSPLVLRLVTPDGKAELLQATGRGGSLVIALPAALSQGTHVLSWRVVSLDGHPVGGTVVFSIGAPSSPPQVSATNANDRAVSAALWFCKLVIYTGLFVGVGGSFFRARYAFGPSGDVEPILTIALVSGLIATPLAVGLQGADALNVPPQGLTSKTVWQAGLATSFGLTAVAAEFAVFAGLFSLQASSRPIARALSLFGLAAAGTALALSGHASAASPQWLTRPSVFLHVTAIAFWIGALLPLAAALRDRTTGATVLAAFSRAIPWTLVPLIMSGVVLAVVQVDQPGLLLTTAYGWLLCAKLALVALLLALAAWNRFRLTPAIAAGGTQQRQQLRRSIAIELAIVAIILGLVASWRFTPPPRAIAIAAARPVQMHIHTAQAMADVTVTPGHAGPVQLSIIILDGNFGGLDAKELQVTLENKGAGVEAISRAATKGADAIWRVEQFPIQQNGRWDVQVDILVNDFEKIQLLGTIDIGM